jgi:hypothetical protein
MTRVDRLDVDTHVAFRQRDRDRVLTQLVELLAVRTDGS